MEESVGDATYWSCHTNWPVLDGGLQSCISVESTASPANDDDDDDDDTSVPTPLLLQRPSPESEPCEIKIVFAKKHQVRQIYIRSTARIYEVYHSPKLKSHNEYLCTVRCSQVEVSPDHENEAAGSSIETESQQMAAETSSTRSSNTSSNEDGWVAVKSIGTDADDKSRNAVAMPMNGVCQEGVEEDLYEATAEISNGDSCMSLTLRLLSIQNKGYVYVDEVYVFADPVDADESEDQPNPMGNMVGSSLMAMLAPSLYQLQLSKPSLSKPHNKSTMEEQREHVGSHGEISVPTNNLAENRALAGSQQPMKLLSLCAPARSPEPIHPHISTRMPDIGANYDLTTKEHVQPSSRIEGVLDQLVSRMSKLEDICSRFEENMLKPILGIEDRLQRVEQQLSVLTKNSQNIKDPSGTRFSAPDWSSCESASNSSDVNEINPICGSSNTLDNPSDTSPTHSSGNASPVPLANTELPPRIISTNGPKLEDHDTEQKELDPPIPKEPQKKTVTIDDALASALAAFLSPPQPRKITTAFSITAPEFSYEEECENDITDKYGDRSAPTTSSAIHGDLGEAEHEEASISISNSVASRVQESIVKDTSSDKFEEHNPGCSLDAAEGDLQLLSDVHGPDDDKPALNLTKRVSAHTGYMFEEGIETHSSESGLTRIESEEGDFNPLWAASEVTIANQEALQDVLGISSMPSPLNFETSVLNVTFASGKFSRTSSLETLLTDVALGFEVDASQGAELANESAVTNEHDDLIFVCEDETSNCTTSDFALNTLCAKLEATIIKDEYRDVVAKDFSSPCSHEVFPVSLI